MSSPDSSDTASSPPSEQSLPSTTQPEWTYKDFFNAHVSSFFDLTYLDQNLQGDRIRKLPHRLRASKITLECSYYQPEERPISLDSDDQHTDGSDSDSKSAFEDLQGTYWTPEEKDIFFNCLARYTIHRVDEFEQHLPKKTIAEILAYYTLLKNELRQLKTCQEVEIPDQPQKLPLNVLRGGISYGSLPIAYEVSDDWLQYETEESDLAAQKCQRLLTKEVSRRKARFEEYTEHSSSECLINVATAHDVASIYRENSITPVQKGKPSCRLEFDSTVFLEELARLRLQQLMAQIAVEKGQKHEPDSEVLEGDIWKAAQSLNLFEVGNPRFWHGQGSPLSAYWREIQGGQESPEAEQEAPVSKRNKVSVDPFLRPIFRPHEFSTYSDFLIDKEARGESTISDEEPSEDSGELGSTSDANEGPFRSGKAGVVGMLRQETRPKAPLMFEQLEKNSPLHGKRTLEQVDYEDWLVASETSLLEVKDAIRDRKNLQNWRKKLGRPSQKYQRPRLVEIDPVIALWESTFAEY